MEIEEYVKTKADVLRNKLLIVDHQDDLNSSRPLVDVRQGDNGYWRATYSMPDFNIKHLNEAKREGWDLITIDPDTEDSVYVMLELQEEVTNRG